MQQDVNFTRLASVLMAKGIDLPWRSQPNLTLYVPFEEWLKFVEHYSSILSNRQPVSYAKVKEASELLKYHYYMFDIGWALYNEVMVSANSSQDATLILPKFPDGTLMTIDECCKRCLELPRDKTDLYAKRFATAVPQTIFLADPSFSQWNEKVFMVSLYLQSFAYSKSIEKFNIVEE